MMYNAYIAFLFSVFVASIAQVILKYAAIRHYAYWWQAYLNPRVIGAYGLFFCSTLMTIWAYRILPLSTGMILDATGYFYVALFGRIFFGERLTMRKILALMLIAGGLCVYGILG